LEQQRVVLFFVLSRFFLFLADSLLMVLDLLPPESIVGLVTFGSTVHVYELGFEAMPKAHVFSGERDVPAEKLRGFLGLGAARAAAGQAVPVASTNAFLRP
jgi:protein transport protein SEC23